MSNTYIADSTDDAKSDDTLIIIVNADGTLSVDPETLQKLIANQHHKSAISVVRVDGEGSNTCDDGSCAESDEDKNDEKGEVNSHVNLTVEGFYPPSHVMSSSSTQPLPPVTLQPTSTTVLPPSTVVETSTIVEADSGGADVLADPFSQMEPEELEKLETALQSEQAKQILGENVTAMLDMLSVDDSRPKPLLLSQQESIMMDHCYTNLTGPTDPQTTSVSTIVSPVLTFSVPRTPTSSRGRGRGKAGRGRPTTTTATSASVLQPKGLIPAGATLVPLVKQLVLPIPTLQTGATSLNRLVVNQGAVQGQIHRVVVQNNAIVSQDPAIKGSLIPIQPNTKIVVSKMNTLSTNTDVPILPSTTQSYLTSSSGQLIISSDFDADFLKKKNAEVSGTVTKPRGRGRPPKVGNIASSGRGRGAVNVKKQRPSVGRPLTKSVSDENNARKLEEEMAAVLEDMDSSSLNDQFIPLESIHQESSDIPKKITVNKLPPKKPIIVKIPKKVEETTKKNKEKLLVDVKQTPSKPKPNRKSADSSTTEGSPNIEINSPSLSPSVTIETPVTNTVTSGTSTSQSKKYPKRENRKPPAHLVEALGPALFSTPDIIRRVSTDKPTILQTSSSVTSQTVVTSPVPSSNMSVHSVVPSSSGELATTSVSPSHSSLHFNKSSHLEEDLLVDSAAASLLDNIHSSVSKQEQQLLAEALMLEDLAAIHPEEGVSQEGENVTVEVLPDPNDMLVTTSEITEAQQDRNIIANVNLVKSKHLSQTSLSSYFTKTTVSDDSESVGRTSILSDSSCDSRTKVIVETNEAVVDSTTTAIAVERINSEPPKPYIRKLPPIELPATRSASKRANQQKSPQIQEVQKKPVIITSKKQVTQARERRSSDTKKLSRTSLSGEEDSSADEEDETEEDDNESYNSEDDPDRLWCICQKPHNNRFMICCDSCEEWFHGKCVGITKAMGQKMEHDGVEWSCPNCKKKKQLEGKDEKITQPQNVDLIQSPSGVKEQSLNAEDANLGDESSTKKGHVIEMKNKDNIKASMAEEQTASSSLAVPNSPGNATCIVCKKEALFNSIYCGDECIKKHANESLSVITSDKQGQGNDQSVIVFERKTGRVLAGPNAPLTSNLTSWLLTHPTFEVMRPGILPTSKFYNQKSGSAEISVKQPVQQKPAKNSVLRQTVLNPRVITGAGGKQIQIIAALPQVVVTDTKSSPVNTKSGKGQMVTQQSATKSVTPKPVKSQQVVNQPQSVQKMQTVAVSKTEGNSKTKTIVIKNIKSQLSKGQQQITSLLKIHPQDPGVSDGSLPVISKVSSSSNVVTIAKKSKETSKTQGVSTSTKKQIMPATSASSKKIVKEEGTNKKCSKDEGSSKKSSKEEVKPIAKKVEIKGSDSQSSSNPGDSVKGIRGNVCKAIKDALSVRFKYCDDITMEDEKVESLANSIEDELNALFKDSAKYKNKFRSLVFNIKDPKNQTLFRKIADGSITPDQVVRLTSEEMASQELAQWREREVRHQLDMIKKNELELLQQAKTVVMKTHKGEQVIENDDGISSKNPETSVTELESALNSNIEEPMPSIKEKEFNFTKFEKNLSSEEKHKHSSKKKEDKRKRSRKHSKSSHKKHSRSRSSSRSRKISEKDKEQKQVVGESEKKTNKSKFEEDLRVEVESIPEPAEEKEYNMSESRVQISEEIESDLSDREPSSTVNIKTPPYVEETENLHIWQGTLLMNDVAKFKTTIQEVSGNCTDLASDLPNTVDCVGRINPEIVWDYISKMKKSGTKEILVIKFTAENEEDKMSYLSLYSYLSSRNRMGVVGNASKMIKDFYVLPLASHSPVPQVLLPLDGPGFDEYRAHLLLGIIVRTRRKRIATDRDLPFIPKIQKKTQRSYTPPIPGEDGSLTPPNPPPVSESFTPPLSPSNSELKIKKVKDTSNSTGSDAFDIEDNDTPYSPIDDDTPYSPGDGEEEVPLVSSPGDMECSAELQRKMDELNRRIEEQKKQIVSISSAIGVEPSEHIITESQEDEAYSPSRSFTPPAVTESIPFLNSQPLPDIALPSNLQEILASIKKQPLESKVLDIKLDPIVQAYSKVEEPYSPGDKPDLETGDSSGDNIAPVTSESCTAAIINTQTDIKISRDPRQRSESKRSISSLSQLSDEELIRKAAEMGFMNPENPKPIPDIVKRRTASDQPPPPGLEDEYNFPSTAEISPTSVLPPHQASNFSAPTYSTTPFTHFPPAGPPLPPPPPPPLPPMLPYPLNYIAPPQVPPLYQQGLPMPHIPYTNPQPPPPDLLFPPPQPPPPQLPPEPIQKPPPPKEPSSGSVQEEKREIVTRKNKKVEKVKSDSTRSNDSNFENRRLSSESKHNPESSISKSRVEKRKYSESSSKDYQPERNSSKKREKFIRKRDKRENWEYEKLPEKRRESWEYDAPSVAAPLPLQGLPPRGGMRGRFHHQRGRFQMRRGFDRPVRGYHRGFHASRGHLPGPSRGFHSKRMDPRGGIQSEWEEEIRQFEEKQRHRSNKLKLKMEEKKRGWRSSTSPLRKRRSKDSDTET